MGLAGVEAPLSPAGKAGANGFTFPVAKGVSGPYEYLVGIWPPVPVVGRLHMATSLTSAKTPVTDAEVLVTCSVGANQGDPAPAVSYFLQPWSYELDMELNEPGTWTFEIEINSLLGAAVIEIVLEVAGEQGSLEQPAEEPKGTQGTPLTEPVPSVTAGAPGQSQPDNPGSRNTAAHHDPPGAGHPYSRPTGNQGNNPTRRRQVRWAISKRVVQLGSCRHPFGPFGFGPGGLGAQPAPARRARASDRPHNLARPAEKTQMKTQALLGTWGICLSLLTAVWLGLAFGVEPASANGGTRPLVIKSRSGPYELQVGIFPGSPKVGNLHISIQVKDATGGSSITDATIMVAARGPAGSAGAPPVQAINARQSPQIYDADIHLDAVGSWTLTVETGAGLGRKPAWMSPSK